MLPMIVVNLDINLNNWVILPIRNDLNDLLNHLNQLDNKIFEDLYDELLIKNKTKKEILEIYNDKTINFYIYTNYKTIQ